MALKQSKEITELEDQLSALKNQKVWSSRVPKYYSYFTMEGIFRLRFQRNKPRLSFNGIHSNVHSKNNPFQLAIQLN